MRIRSDTRAQLAVFSLLAHCAVWVAASRVCACTTVMVGRQATADGSVLMASSCDGDVMGLIHVMPAQEYP
ncbi:MAG: C69 family dipeptidase, partial [Planctomycetes bacterium]|nr:C69 family dipeptidase [Planctomycetota bacterium]